MSTTNYIFDYMLIGLSIFIGLIIVIFLIRLLIHKVPEVDKTVVSKDNTPIKNKGDSNSFNLFLVFLLGVVTQILKSLFSK